MVTNRAGMEASPATERGTRGTDLGPAIGELLKTPTAQLAVNGGSQHPDKRRAGGHGPTLADQVEHELLPTPTAREKGGRNARHGDTSRGNDLPEAIRYLPTPGATDGKGASQPGGDRASTKFPRGNPTLAGALLPTPRATDGTKGGPNQRGSSGDLMLPSAVMQLLPTPSVADGEGGHLTRSGERGGELLLPGVAKALSEGKLLPTPAAHDSGNSPEEHLRKKPGRQQVTSLAIIAENRLLSTGGRTSSPSGDGSASPAGPRHRQPFLGEPGSD